MRTHTHTAVARRCIPTFIDQEDQLEESNVFNTTEDIQTVATSDGFGDLVLIITDQELVNGTL